MELGKQAADGEDFICKLPKALEELLIVAEIIPDHVLKQMFEKPEAFHKIASLDDKSLDLLVKTIKVT